MDYCKECDNWNRDEGCTMKKYFKCSSFEELCERGPIVVEKRHGNSDIWDVGRRILYVHWFYAGDESAAKKVADFYNTKWAEKKEQWAAGKTISNDALKGE